MHDVDGTKRRHAYSFLDAFRGTDFEGEWPTVRQMFEITCKRFPSNMCFQAFVPERIMFTYAEANGIVKRTANYLRSAGISHGDRIAVAGKNSPEWALAYLSVLYAGAVVVPLDITLHDDEMERFIEFSGVRKLFIDSDRIDRIQSVVDEKICLEKGSGFPYILDVGLDGEYIPDAAAGGDVAAILFTSGTTGVPKGVMLTNDNLVSDCYLVQEKGYMPLRSDDIFYAILPIHHAYTMLAVFFESISVGAGLIFGKRLVVSQILKELREGKVTMFLAVPMLFNKMLAALMDGIRKKGPVVYALVRLLIGFSGLVKRTFGINLGKKLFRFLLKKLSLETNRICISGGGPLPPRTFKMFNELGIDFVQGYGLTETSPITHLNPVRGYRIASVGRSIPEVQVKIVEPDEEGNGLIFLRGPMVMKGYYHNQDATDEVLSQDGWLNTGDVGHTDDAGFLYLTGRAKNIIVTEGGKNVFPEEIEDRFQLYSDIEQICIVAYEIDPRQKAEGIRALIYPSDDARKNYADDSSMRRRMESLVAEVNKSLQPYKKITKVDIVAERMEETSTRKLKRFVIHRKYAS
jgi:long-chain acyl-CoA synthetase